MSNTRQQIIEATERLLQERGLARATTKEIAREAGCAEGTLYKHFEHKEDLFLAVVQNNLPDLVSTLDAYKPGSSSLQTNLTSICQAIVHYYDQVIPSAASFFADLELLCRYRQLLHELKAGPIRLHERVAAYIEQEQRLGRINSQLEPLMVVSLLLGPCFQYVFNRHFLGADPFPMTDQQFIEGVIQTLLAGLNPQNP